MSCHGTCRTPLLELNVAHVVSMDDFGGPANPLRSRLDIYVRVYRWEFQLSLSKPHRKFYLSRGHGNIPHLFMWDAQFDTVSTKQYSGDFTERMHDDPYYGQRPR